MPTEYTQLIREVFEEVFGDVSRAFVYTGNPFINLVDKGSPSGGTGQEPGSLLNPEPTLVKSVWGIPRKE